MSGRTKPTPQDEGASANPIGDVNTPLVGPTSAPELAEVVTAPPQFFPSLDGPHYARTEVDVTIQVDPYKGFKFRIWKNHKIRQQNMLWLATTTQERAAAFRVIFVKHYNWHDLEGNPFPVIAENPAGFIEECPPDLYQAMLEAMREEARRVPDFLRTDL